MRYRRNKSKIIDATLRIVPLIGLVFAGPIHAGYSWNDFKKDISGSGNSGAAWIRGTANNIANEVEEHGNTFAKSKANGFNVTRNRVTSIGGGVYQIADNTKSAAIDFGDDVVDVYLKAEDTVVAPFNDLADMYNSGFQNLIDGVVITAKTARDVLREESTKRLKEVIKQGTDLEFLENVIEHAGGDVIQKIIKKIAKHEKFTVFIQIAEIQTNIAEVTGGVTLTIDARNSRSMNPTDYGKLHQPVYNINEAFESIDSVSITVSNSAQLITGYLFAPAVSASITTTIQNPKISFYDSFSTPSGVGIDVTFDSQNVAFNYAGWGSLSFDGKTGGTGPEFEVWLNKTEISRTLNSLLHTDLRKPLTITDWDFEQSMGVSAAYILSSFNQLAWSKKWVYNDGNIRNLIAGRDSDNNRRLDGEILLIGFEDEGETGLYHDSYEVMIRSVGNGRVWHARNNNDRIVKSNKSYHQRTDPDFVDDNDRFIMYKYYDMVWFKSVKYNKYVYAREAGDDYELKADADQFHDDCVFYISKWDDFSFSLMSWRSNKFVVNLGDRLKAEANTAAAAGGGAHAFYISYLKDETITNPRPEDFEILDYFTEAFTVPEPIFDAYPQTSDGEPYQTVAEVKIYGETILGDKLYWTNTNASDSEGMTRAKSGVENGDVYLMYTYFDRVWFVNKDSGKPLTATVLRDGSDNTLGEYVVRGDADEFNYYSNFVTEQNDDGTYSIKSLNTQQYLSLPADNVLNPTGGYAIDDEHKFHIVKVNNL